MLRSRGDIDKDEFAIAAVLVKIRARDDENDSLAVGRNLRVGDGSDFRVVAQLHVPHLRASGTASEDSYDQ